MVFDKLIEALVFGAGYERIADAACSAITLRRRRDEWIRLGIFDALRLAALDAYDTMIGLDGTARSSSCRSTRSGSPRHRAHRTAGRAARRGGRPG